MCFRTKSLKKINSIKRKLKEKNKAVKYVREFLNDNIENIVERVSNKNFLIESLKTIFDKVIRPVEQNNSMIKNQYEIVFPRVTGAGRLFRAEVLPGEIYESLLV